MTKNQKIEILLKENRQLTEENNRLKELSTEFKQDEVKQAVDDLKKTYKLLKKEYKKLDQFRFIGLKTKLQYYFINYTLKIRSLLGM